MDSARLVQLDAALQSLALGACPFKGTIFRVLPPLYANKADAFSGHGSLRASGRYHAQGAFLIVYAGCTLKQAEWEYANTSRNSGLTREESLPLAILSADVD